MYYYKCRSLKVSFYIHFLMEKDQGENISHLLQYKIKVKTLKSLIEVRKSSKKKFTKKIFFRKKKLEISLIFLLTNNLSTYIMEWGEKDKLFIMGVAMCHFVHVYTMSFKMKFISWESFLLFKRIFQFFYLFFLASLQSKITCLW